MKDPSTLHRRKKTKLKLVISFNGEFRRRPPSGKLRYIGGETRIISVDRNVSFSRLESRVADLVCPNAVVFSRFCLRYHVAESFCRDDEDEQERPIFGILESDDDVQRMIEEHESMEWKGKLHTRLWIFVCNSSCIDEVNDCGFVDNHVLSVNGVGICGKNDGFVKTVGEGLGDVDNKTIVSENLVAVKFEGRVKKFSADSLRKMVLKQQMMAKKLGGVLSFRGCVEKSDIELMAENEICEPPVMELCFEPGGPLYSEPRNLNFGEDLYGMSALDYKYTDSHVVACESLGNNLPVPVPKSFMLNAKDGNLPLDGARGSLWHRAHMIFDNGNNRSMGSANQLVSEGQAPKLSSNVGMNMTAEGLDANHEFRRVDPAFSRSVNGENCRDASAVKNGFVPLCRNELMDSIQQLSSLQTSERQWSRYHGGVRNHKIGPSEARNQIIYPYHIRNRSNNETGNHHNLRLDGRSWVGKFYPGLRSSSNIMKHGPFSRSQNTASRKSSGSHYYKMQGAEAITDSGHMFNFPSGDAEYLIQLNGHRGQQHKKANPGESDVASGGTGTVTNEKSLLPIDTVGNISPGARAVDTQIHLLTSPGREKLDAVGQALVKNGLVALDGQTALEYTDGLALRNQQEVVTFSNSPYNPCYGSATELSCHNKSVDREADCETFNTYQSQSQRHAHNFKSSIAHAVDLSLHKLSLESSEKVQLPTPSAVGRDNEVLLKPQLKGLDLMDEECLNLNPKVEKSSDVSSDSSLNNVVKWRNSTDGKEEIQEDSKSILGLDKDETKRSNTSLKVNSGNTADPAAFYTHLATRELQTIENSDLEHIKELGSGTYGTVFYGKWKGSDVAIKRIKPSCFTHGAMEDRLVADFWKEAHILGQLRHPNIVALYGVVSDGPVNNLATVTEYMVNGSLKQVLRRKDRTIDRRKRIIIAMDAAFGMEYLHEKNIVHFDLKSHNFLVNMRDPQRPVCKIGDLGLSKIKQRTLVSGGVRGTIPWMAPELLNGQNLVSEKVDVFSFGIVMWELLTGEEPYADMRSEEIIVGIIRGNLRPKIPRWCDPMWRSLMERCWSSDPDSRPSFSEIAMELRAMAATMNIK